VALRPRVVAWLVGSKSKTRLEENAATALPTVNALVNHEMALQISGSAPAHGIDEQPFRKRPRPRRTLPIPATFWTRACRGISLIGMAALAPCVWDTERNRVLHLAADPARRTRPIKDWNRHLSAPETIKAVWQSVGAMIDDARDQRNRQLATSPRAARLQQRFTTRPARVGFWQWVLDA